MEIKRSQWILAGVIVALAGGCLFYQVLTRNHWEQTAALFIGLPAFLALVFTLTPQAKSVTGIIMKTMTILLLLSGMFLMEGAICILMAAPIFYLVGLIAGLTADYFGRWKMKCAVWIVLLIMSIEGLHENVSFDRESRIVSERIIPVNRKTLFACMAIKPDFHTTLPLFLRMGFPRPVAVQGGGLKRGDKRRVTFAGGEGKPGDLVIEVVEVNSQQIKFKFLEDSSHISHWLRWDEAIVHFKDLEGDRCEVKWDIRYERRLDPAWYFGPIESFGVKQAANYLLKDLERMALAFKQEHLPRRL